MNNIENNNLEKSDIKKIFVDKLNQIMDKHNIKTDSELLKQIDIPQSRFSNIRNKNNPTLPTVMELIQLSNYFNVEVDYFLFSNTTNQNGTLDINKLTELDLLRFILELDIKNIIDIQPELEEYFNEFGSYTKPTGKYTLMVNRDSIQGAISEWFNYRKNLTDINNSYVEKMIEVLMSGILNNFTFGSEIPLYMDFMDIPEGIDEELPFD